MSGFSSKWLTAREPVDHAARSETVLSAIGHYFLDQSPLRLTDIGCGTGSTLRAIKPFFTQPLEWHLIDQDKTLLSHARKAAGEDDVQFTKADLSSSLDSVFKYSPDLVTTSAFLDLVSEAWLEWFVTEIAIRKIPFYAALSYDGRAECSPQHESDSAILSAFNTHQETDKGFGPALGPRAADMAADLFKQAGYVVLQEPSDWIGDKNHPEFQEMLLEGWCSAATEIKPTKTQEFSDWLSFRKEKIRQGESRVMVGHKDMFAVPNDKGEI